MPMKTKHEVVTEFRTLEILNAARSLFARKGFTGTTMDDIAEEAGLAKGTLYLYFSSKQDIYLKALQVAVASLIEQTDKEMASCRTIQEKIRAYVVSRLKYAEENRDFCKIYLQEVGSCIHPATVNKEYRNFDQRRTQALKQVLKEARQRGEIRSIRLEAAAAIILDMTRGLIMHRLLGGSKESIEEDSNFLCDFILNGIGV
jgi:AcrR family transcriptional regulator